LRQPACSTLAQPLADCIRQRRHLSKAVVGGACVLIEAATRPRFSRAAREKPWPKPCVRTVRDGQIRGEWPRGKADLPGACPKRQIEHSREPYPALWARPPASRAATLPPNWLCAANGTVRIRETAAKRTRVRSGDNFHSESCARVTPRSSKRAQL
jgi:hypothetical protein